MDCEDSFRVFCFVWKIGTIFQDFQRAAVKRHGGTTICDWSEHSRLELASFSFSWRAPHGMGRKKKEVVDFHFSLGFQKGDHRIIQEATWSICQNVDELGSN